MSERKNIFAGQVSDFDIRLLRIFKTVAECGGFTAAEVPLGISRSAISIHMNDLESRLGLKLCQRGRAGFALTEEGREVLAALHRLLASLEAFRGDVNALHHHLRGELSIGITDNLVSMPQMRVTEALATLKAQGPAVRINIEMIPPDEVELGVLDHRLHVGVMPWITRLEGLDYRPLYTERSELYCAYGHPLFEIDDAKLDDAMLKGIDAVSPSYAVPADVHARYSVLTTAASASDREGVAFLLLTGRYIGYLPDHVARPWVAQGRLRALAPERYCFETPFVAITRRGRRPHRVLDTFLAALDNTRT